MTLPSQWVVLPTSTAPSTTTTRVLMTQTTSLPPSSSIPASTTSHGTNVEIRKSPLPISPPVTIPVASGGTLWYLHVMLLEILLQV